MNIHSIIKNSINAALKTLNVEAKDIQLEHPGELSHGDFSTNVAMMEAKTLGKNPRELAEVIVAEIQKQKPEEIENIEVAGPGFINFFLSRNFFTQSLKEITETKTRFGRHDTLKAQKILIEYTDPNPFKVFHAGHVMSNAVGEALSRLLEWSGADVLRANYQGDVGPHIAKALWGMIQLADKMPADGDSLSKKTEFLGNAYSFGSQAAEESPAVKTEIDEMNTEIYNGTNEEFNNLYKIGRQWSLDHFEEIYKKLGTKFDYYFFESEVAKGGVRLVKEGLEKGIFEESEGAVIFPGEKYGLHTRVFITSRGVPTYEAKELGLFKRKKETVEADRSITVTANEQDEYYKVALKALEQLDLECAGKTTHISHGLLRTPEGKMSSRKGNVLSGEGLIEEVERRVKEKVADRELSPEEKKDIAEVVAVGALKYSILKQEPGKNIIFDMEKSLSFEGDSGPYLQYTHTRIRSILEKAKEADIKVSLDTVPDEPDELERLLYRFPEVVERAAREYAPQLVVHFLLSVAGEFNSFYGREKIVDTEDRYSPYKLVLTQVTGIVIKNGLTILGIQGPDKM